MSRNYRMAPQQRNWINTSIASNDQMLGSNGQCTMFACQEWIDGVSCYPELEREERYGFAICPKCGGSYGADAMTGEEHRLAMADRV